MYPLVKIPEFADKDIYSFSKEEAKEYFKWFLSIKNERMQILEKEIKQNFPNWKLDFTRHSLVDLYEWFVKKVMYRSMTDNETEAFRNQIAQTPQFIGVIDIPTKTYTEETVSICFDIGIYLGDTIIINVNGTKWMQKINSTNYIDYVHPLIATKVSKVPFNPRRITESMAGSILDKSDKSFSFLELYDDLVVKFSKEIK